MKNNNACVLFRSQTIIEKNGKPPIVHRSAFNRIIWSTSKTIPYIHSFQLHFSFCKYDTRSNYKDRETIHTVVKKKQTLIYPQYHQLVPAGYSLFTFHCHHFKFQLPPILIVTELNVFTWSSSRCLFIFCCVIFFF